ncbi:hypothetical protein COMA2_160008 [Candidatus Nitrospira nitrificans]|uniref:Uncharacterized protein n=1 Tax=Candidatus Nitrospira nitrificans TaxID=1742973 RepID=A0A0S4LC22_9BACT|nr:hypothetical protein COMA2_160008 [Candidatus Nitrospira nitrificans]
MAKRSHLQEEQITIEFLCPDYKLYRHGTAVDCQKILYLKHIFT